VKVKSQKRFKVAIFNQNNKRMKAMKSQLKKLSLKVKKQKSLKRTATNLKKLNKTKIRKLSQHKKMKDKMIQLISL
jgi:hypothetical protein